MLKILPAGRLLTLMKCLNENGTEALCTHRKRGELIRFGVREAQLLKIYEFKIKKSYLLHQLFR